MTLMITALLITALLAAGISALGVCLARDAFDRIHYLGPVKIIGTLGILLAVLLQDGFTLVTGKTAIVAFIILLTGPVITHAIARAGVVRGDARSLRGESGEIGEIQE